MHGQRKPAQKAAFMQILHQVVHAHADVGSPQKQRLRGLPVRGLVVHKRKDRRAHQHGGGMLAGLLQRKRCRDHGGRAVAAAHHAGHEAGAVVHVQAGNGLVALQRPEIVDEEIVRPGPSGEGLILAGQTALRCGPCKDSACMPGCACMRSACAMRAKADCPISGEAASWLATCWTMTA